MNKNFKMLSGKDYNYLTVEQINNRLRTNMMVLYALSEAGDNPAVKHNRVYDGWETMVCN